MSTFIIYNTATGEIDGDCSICGIWSGYSELEMINIKSEGFLGIDHDFKLVDENLINPYMLKEDRSSYKYKIDVSKQGKDIVDKEKK